MEPWLLCRNLGDRFSRTQVLKDASQVSQSTLRCAAKKQRQQFAAWWLYAAFADALTKHREHLDDTLEKTGLLVSLLLAVLRTKFAMTKITFK